MIVVTGAVGFIGSCLITELNNLSFNNLVLVDDFSFSDKNKNILNKKYIKKIDRLDFIEWLSNNSKKIDFLYHIGARTDTSEFNTSIFEKLNLSYSKDLWMICEKFQIPFVYASSAATYGMGEFGFNDDHDSIQNLQPLNQYGTSKNDFDKWVIKQNNQPPFWAGFKFFNVYGPNEFHKERMSSVVYQAFKQIKENSEVKLFRSHNTSYEDGKQLRDFIYVKDVVKVLIFIMNNREYSGIYNLGTGIARTFYDLAVSTFKAMGLASNLLFIDTPIDIRDKYQYFTQANMNKLTSIGYNIPFFTLEEGIEDYVKNYLLLNRYY